MAEEVQNTEQRSSYRSIFKATSLFGGVQIFNIIINVIRSKFIAVILGPNGMGISGLISSTVNLISELSNCGLNKSAIRNIAEANSTGDTKKIAGVVQSLQYVIWITGIIGTIICALFAPMWSKLTFGNTDYTYAFIILSISVLLLQLTNGKNALLQGLQKYKYLAVANILGSSIGLIITVPLYYIWGINAIVPVLLLSYVTSFLCALYYFRKVHLDKIEQNKTDRREIASNMIKLGIALSVQSLLSLLSSYVIRIFISNTGGISEVGLYNAGFAIINTYVGLIFTAMAQDYYPRLSNVKNNHTLFESTINNQTEVAVLLLAPMIVCFVVFIDPIIILLYSDRFTPISGMIYWCMSGMILKAMAWAKSYALIAQGDIKSFTKCEFSVIAYGFVLNFLGYYFLGLTGIGASFLVIYIIYLIHLSIVVKKKYSYRISFQIWKLIFIISLPVLLSFIIKLLDKGIVINYILGSVIFVSSVVISLYELNKRLGISNMIKGKFHHK